MGKNLRQQRRGKGTPRYVVPSHRYHGKAMFPDRSQTKGIVTDIMHAPGRKTPVAVAEFSGKKQIIIPRTGMQVGEEFEVLPLGKIAEGSKIFNIELNPGDGGRLCRTSGVSAVLIGKEGKKCTVIMPSKKKKILSAECRAMIGYVAGDGRIEKPFRKAGTKHHQAKALGKLFPITSGVSMNPVDHPFGGKTKVGKHKTVSRHMPPGKKVGSISARRTGKKK